MNIAMLNHTTGKKHYKNYRSVSQIVAELAAIDQSEINEISDSYQSSFDKNDQDLTLIKKQAE